MGLILPGSSSAFYCRLLTAAAAAAAAAAVAAAVFDDTRVRACLSQPAYIEKKEREREMGL